MIDYAGLAIAFGHDTAAFKAFLFETLPDLWCDAYRVMPASDVEMVQFRDDGYEFLFDLGSERVIAAFGLSRRNRSQREQTRMRGFLDRTVSTQKLNTLPSGQRQLASLSWRDRFFETHGHEYDRGHFISHLQGGGLDVNLFPQLTRINRGRGPEGAAYRAMERECVVYPGSFCFSRPIYDDMTWVPFELEYGILRSPHEIQVRIFPNRTEG
jgi:hypothetical protein